MRALRGLVLGLTGALLAPLAGACARAPLEPTHVLDGQGPRRPLDAPAALPLALAAVLEGPAGARLRLVGAAVPREAAPGDRVPVALAFVVERAPQGEEPEVFVHAAAPGAEVSQAGADHPPLAGAHAPSTWQRGDLLVDRFELLVPRTIGVDALVVHVGLFEAGAAGKERWRVSPATAHDGRERIEVGRISIPGAPPLMVSADVKRRTGPVVLDGALDEPDWQRATRLGPFVAYDGRSRIERRTWARMLWDEESLWVAFEGEDPDVFTPYAKRDDPLYESEAIEVFIDADGDQDVYVELQAAPANDVHFDAAFSGGRRKNMDRAWNAPYETKTVTTPAGFTSEWRIPVRALKDIPAGEPRAGAQWRVNLFRLERVRDVPRSERVVRTEAAAWSSPLSGDFHNLDRFGTIRFVD
jgi:hypothetical protein